MILLDTSILVDALTGQRRSSPALTAAIRAGERIGVAALVLYEWLRGPRNETELEHQEALLPGDTAVPFGAAEAAIAAALYRRARRARQRELDLAIAAVAIARDALLWTLNPQDFRDLPGLRLYTPPA